MVTSTVNAAVKPAVIKMTKQIITIQKKEGSKRQPQSWVLIPLSLQKKAKKELEGH
jgi:hypothetical protein